MGIDLDLATIERFAIAILIGALVGIEREKRRDTETTIGGIRTFALMAMLGAAGGLLSRQFNTIWPLLVVTGIGGITVVAGFLMDAEERKGPVRLITELAAIVVTVLAGLATLGQPALAVSLGIILAALLAFEQPIHGLIDKIGWDDIFGGLRLLIASFIVLPLLPNRTIDPWHALNPRELWFLVVLISALSAVGYVATRWLGPSRGAVVMGLAGGLVSSTAATLAFSRQSREAGTKDGARLLAIGSLIAWTVMFARVLSISFVVNSDLLRLLIEPVGAMALATLVSIAGLFWLDFQSRKVGKEQLNRGSATIVVSTPFTLTQAAKFGLLFAVILVLVKIVGDRSQHQALYLVALFGGLADVDAITLSMNQYARSTGVDQVATVAIIVALLANSAVKAGMAATLGSADYRRIILGAAALLAIAGAVAIVRTLVAG